MVAALALKSTTIMERPRPLAAIHDHGGSRTPGDCINNPKSMTSPSATIAGWLSNGPQACHRTTRTPRLGPAIASRTGKAPAPPGARRQGRPAARVKRGNPATVRLHVAFGAGDGDCYVLGAGVDLELEPLAVRDPVAG